MATIYKQLEDITVIFTFLNTYISILQKHKETGIMHKKKYCLRPCNVVCRLRMNKTTPPVLHVLSWHVRGHFHYTFNPHIINSWKADFFTL